MVELADVLAEMDQDYRNRLNDFELYRDYLDGKHRFDWASPLSKSKIDWALRTAQENLCPAVVDIYVDKTQVIDWGVDGTNLDPEALDRLAAMVHAEAHAMGNAFAIVWRNPKTGEPVPAFQRANQCIPIVDEEDPSVLRALAKVWTRKVDGRARLNVYDKDGLTRWISRDKYTVTATNGSGEQLIRPDDWTPFETDDMPSYEAHDFGVVPAVWFKRKATDQFAWGVSVLRDVIPAQDELNKTGADGLVSSERIALPIRYVMDVAPELLQPKLNPETGKLEPPKIPFDESVNSILTMTAKGPAGQFPGPDGVTVIKFQERAEDKMFNTAGIPNFYLLRAGGTVPSGIALQILSSRLVSAVKAFTRDNTPTWRGLLELLGVAEPVIKWADPMPLSTEEQLANAVTEKDLGMPVEEWLRTAGYDPDETDNTGATLADRVRAAMRTSAQDIAGALYAGEAPASY